MSLRARLALYCLLPALAAPGAGRAQDAAALLTGDCPAPADFVSAGAYVETLDDPDGALRALRPCLADPDPAARDGFGYGVAAALMRGGHVTPEAVRDLADALIPVLAAPDDADGFARPFAALVLAEAARADRLGPVFDAAQRQAVADAAAAYLPSVTDYRGFDASGGWRHGVAHGADLLMQLSLNDALTPAQQRTVRDAVASQVAPAEHFYVYGEPGRLARPILFLAAQDAFTEGEWTAWFAALADPAPLPGWDSAYESQAGLARLHNLRAFAESVYVNADASGGDSVKALLPGALAVLQTLP